MKIILEQTKSYGETAVGIPLNGRFRKNKTAPFKFKIKFGGI